MGKTERLGMCVSRYFVREVFFLIGLLLLSSVFAVDAFDDEESYVSSSVASVRTQPHDDAPVAGKIPIGTKVRRTGNCNKGYPVQEGGNRWVCVSLWLPTVNDGGYWSGWVAGDLLSSEAPQLAGLISQYDRTPKADLVERRKLAERAVALEPTDGDAQRRLVEVLSEIPDVSALAGAKRGFAAYQARPLDVGRGKVIFAFSDGKLEPIAQMKDGRVVMGYDWQAYLDYLDRGHFYNLYFGGQKVGVAVTEMQFNCRAADCPFATLVRTISDQGFPYPPTGLATNYTLGQAATPMQQPSAVQKLKLRELALASVKKSSAPFKEAFLRHIEKGEGNPTFGVGHITNGRTILIGNWIMGTMSNWFYVEEPYATLLIIAEQQPDGSVVEDSVSGPIGCKYVSHADLDADGSDEIVWRCDGVEGEYQYGLLRRVDNKWEFTKGNMR